MVVGRSADSRRRSSFVIEEDAMSWRYIIRVKAGIYHSRFFLS